MDKSHLQRWPAAWLFPILMSLYRVARMTLVMTWPIAFILIAVGAPQIGKLPKILANS